MAYQVVVPNQILQDGRPITPAMRTWMELITRIVAQSGTPGESGDGGLMPWFIPADETFTIEENEQGLFSLPIDVEGYLVVDGYAIHVRDEPAGSGGGGSGTPLEVEDEGVSVDADVVNMDFRGDGVSVVQTAAGHVRITIPGAGFGDLFASLYGSGIDGSAILTGNSGEEPDWVTVFPLNGVDYWELNRNVALENLTVNSGVHLYTRGYVLWVNGTLINNGIVGAPGGSGGGSTGKEGGRGGGVTSAYVGVGRNGGNGGLDSAGSAGTNTAENAIGGAGGNGGSGKAGANAGGSGGTVSFPTAAFGGIHAALTFNTVVNHGHVAGGGGYQGGAGGGGGGGGVSGFGGQGGGGGGVSYIAARNIAGSGVITCAGGDGSDGVGDTGGGGGGGGGFLIIVTETSNYDSLNTVTVAGGSGGAGGDSGGAAGQDGGDGYLLELITPSS